MQVVRPSHLVKRRSHAVDSWDSVRVVDADPIWCNPHHIAVLLVKSTKIADIASMPTLSLDPGVEVSVPS